MRRIVLGFLVIVISLCIFSIGYGDSNKVQYENFEWGMKKKEVKRLCIKKDYKDIEECFQYKLCYEDRIFDRKVVVRMSFTPISNKLWRVHFFEDNLENDKFLYNKLKKTYNEKYNKVDEYKNMWKGSGENISLIELEYVYNYNYSKVTYISKKYFQMYEKEKKQRDKKQEEKL